MKRRMRMLAACAMIALLAMSALGAGPALAAQWAEGRSAAQPYANVPEVNLEETMGYILLFPSQKLPVENFCDRLMLFLPREDLSLAEEGSLKLYGEEGELAELTVADASIRALDEDELEALIWGGGSCVEIRLPVSLSLGQEYYVLVDEGFLEAPAGVSSPAITNPEAWKFRLDGDYGIEAAQYQEAEDGSGATLTFNLTLGGDVASATLFSEDNSVFFEQTEFNQSAEVTGTVTGDAPSWGVVFLNAEGQVLDVLEPGN